MENKFAYKRRIIGFGCTAAYKECIFGIIACTYNTLRKGQAFYIPSGKVKNTNNVKVDYILYRTLDNNNGMNIGIKQESGKFVPLTVLISRQSSLNSYIDVGNFKLVEKLEITDMLGNIIETISYAISKDANK